MEVDGQGHPEARLGQQTPAQPTGLRGLRVSKDPSQEQRIGNPLLSTDKDHSWAARFNS